MEGLGSLLIFAILFFFMMRMHGHGGHGQSHGAAAKQIDPVCGVQVEADKGYGKMYQGTLHRFCSRECLDKFDSDPHRYLDKQEADHGA